MCGRVDFCFSNQEKYSLVFSLSCLIFSLVPYRVIAPAEDSYRKSVIIDEQTALLDILDTAGQEEFSSMQDQWMREGKGFLLVYNITSRSTFDEVSLLYDKILRSKDKDKVPMVLVGNKCDLEKDRQVPKQAGETLAAKWGCPFYEASAKERINNEQCFFDVVREIRKQDNKPAKKEGKKDFCNLL